MCSLLLRTLWSVLNFPQSEAKVSKTLPNLESHYLGKGHSPTCFKCLLNVIYLRAFPLAAPLGTPYITALPADPTPLTHFMFAQYI